MKGSLIMNCGPAWTGGSGVHLPALDQTHITSPGVLGTHEIEAQWSSVQVLTSVVA
jgi:hypothetical protein